MCVAQSEERAGATRTQCGLHRLTLSVCVCVCVCVCVARARVCVSL
jgi:hypothetical protein